eukprot:36957-Rhodomonas_salina.3
MVLQHAWVAHKARAEFLHLLAELRGSDNVLCGVRYWGAVRCVLLCAVCGTDTAYVRRYASAMQCPVLT